MINPEESYQMETPQLHKFILSRKNAAEYTWISGPQLGTALDI